MAQDKKQEIDVSIVARLISEQFPQWSHLPISLVRTAGTSNSIYRLGDMIVRLPRSASSALQVDKEQRWLPVIAPQVPLAIPTILGKGRPSEVYPMPWSIYSWIEGEDATVARIINPCHAAVTLGNFVASLHRINPEGGPLPGQHNFFRGVPLAERDEEVHEAIQSLHGIINTDIATAAWERSLLAPIWSHSPVWIHGDLIPTNLLVNHGQLSAVIDFGGMAVGDPAVDLIPAWTFLSSDCRDLFRAAVGVDDATWERGKGWALSFGLIALPYYMESNPVLANIARHSIGEVLADHLRIIRR